MPVFTLAMGGVGSRRAAGGRGIPQGAATAGAEPQFAVLTATVYLADGSADPSRPVRWQSTNPAVVLVTPLSAQRCRVDAIGPGSATVTALVDGGAHSAVALTVLAAN